MKQLIPFLVLSFLVACQSNSSKKQQNLEIENPGKEIVTKKEQPEQILKSLSQDDFFNQIANYKSPQTMEQYIGKKPCIIDFYADWCRPCKMLEPSLKEFAVKYADKIDIYQINVDYSQEVTQSYQINGIPTLFFCYPNEKMIIITGAQSKEQLELNIQKYLLKNNESF